MAKDHKKVCVCVCIYIYIYMNIINSFCWTSESNTKLQINYTPIKPLKNKNKTDFKTIKCKDPLIGS